MILFVALFAFMILSIAILGIAQPGKLVDLGYRIWQSPGGLLFAVALRLVLGLLLVAVAPATRFPTAFLWLGIITIIAGIAALLMGTQRIRSLVDWSLNQSTTIIRCWALIALALALFLLYGIF